jgi:hypothetical protein
MSYARAAGLTDDDLVLVGYVTDKRLRDLYGHTALFVFPFFTRGFWPAGIRSNVLPCPGHRGQHVQPA